MPPIPSHTLRPAPRFIQPQPKPTSIFPFERSTTSGHLSLPADGPVHIVAEPGLQICVHAGCLWVPATADAVGLIVSAGQHAEVHRAGPIWAMAMCQTEIELIWPPLPATGATRPQ